MQGRREKIKGHGGGVLCLSRLRPIKGMQDPSKTQVHTGPVPAGKEDEQLPFPEDNRTITRISDQHHRIDRTYSGTIDKA